MRTTREGRLLRLALDRPNKGNALSVSLCEDLIGAFEAANADRSVGAVSLEADGTAFCAGMDLDEALSGAGMDVHERLFTAGMWLNKPLVAMVQGPAVGGGIGLVAMAHVAVAGEAATFTLAEIRIGMWPFVIWRPLVAAMGERRVLELALTGRTFAAREALESALVHRIGDQQEALSAAHQLAEASPQTLARGLDLARRSRGLAWKEAGELALGLRAETLRSADFREGVQAYREGRSPRWPSLENS